MPRIGEKLYCVEAKEGRGTTSGGYSLVESKA